MNCYCNVVGDFDWFQLVIIELTANAFKLDLLCCTMHIFLIFFYEGTRILCKNCAGDRHKTKLGFLFFDYEAHEVTWICLSIDTDLAAFSWIIDVFSRSGDGDTAKHSLKIHKANFKQISAHVMIIVLT